MKKKGFNYLSTVLGLLLLAAGLVLGKSISEPKGVLLALPYVCIGLGCGAFGYGLGDIINNRTMKKNPQLQKQLQINKNDERNMAISNRAKAKAYDLMLYVFGGLMITFVLIGTDVVAILLTVAAYLFAVGFFIFYLNKYHKEM